MRKPFPTAELRCRYAPAEPLVAVMPPALERGGELEVSLAELGGSPIVCDRRTAESLLAAPGAREGSLAVSCLAQDCRTVCSCAAGGLGVGLVIAPIVSQWMDVCSIYICPVGAFLAGVMFFWVCGKDYVLEQVNLARQKPLGAWFYPMAKYLFCGVTLLVLVLGAVKGGIG